MTVCIAALADAGKSLFLATDTMITMPGLSYEFEKSNLYKMYELDEKECFVLTAGSALDANLIIKEAEKILAKQKIDNKEISFDLIVDIIRRVYQDVRRSKIIQTLLEPRGLNLDVYYKNQRLFVPEIVNEIERALVTYNLNTELIVAGRSLSANEQTYQICTVSNPGVSTCVTPVGYATTGSGALHAMYYLIGTEYSAAKPLEDVEKIVKEAKKQAERAPGVGKTTITKILKIDGGTSHDAKIKTK